MENIIFSLNAIVPIFILVVLGVVLKKIRFADSSFFSVCDKLGFKICLPCLLFLDICDATSADIDGKLIAFCAAAVTVLFLVSGLIVPLFLKENAGRGAFIQGMCRSNAAILGVTIATNMFGQSGAVAVAAVLPVVIGLYNVYSVIVLSIFAPQDVKPDTKTLVKKVVKNIVTNPLILAVVAALIWNVSGIVMPVFLNRSLNYLSDLCVPLALLSLGAGFSLQELKKGALSAFLCSFCKTVLVPLAAVGTAAALGFRGISLSVVMIVFGGPTAISSYTMARQMKSDASMAGEIVLISTLMSAFTLFAGILLLRSLALI